MKEQRKTRVWEKERKESEELNIKTSIAWKHKKVKAFTVSLRRHTPEKLAGKCRGSGGQKRNQEKKEKYKKLTLKRLVAQNMH